MLRFLIATTNEGKFLEIQEGLAGLPLTLLTLKDLPAPPHPPKEGGRNHRENAVMKARFYFQRTKIPTVAEDSGIHVTALEGELGVHTRRWGAGSEASDEEWITHFLERMRGEKNKQARFHCVIALADAIGMHTFEGECPGVITDTLEAAYLPGLPISACFRPDGCGEVFSALSVEEKNAVSHRGRALAQLRAFLEGELALRSLA